jgi:AraC family transcriptional regulator of adaptative response/methylated-DNA-[protein]-cysteine methyltransferase
MIHYHLVTTHLGEVLVARQSDDVCFLHIEDDIETVKNSLREAFPDRNISPHPNKAMLDGTIHALVRGENISPSLSLHLTGTPFQQRVWRAMQSIPTGEIRTYSELAKMVRHPAAVRAVASACAKNQIALLVPCHRVVRTDGTLGGYRWGLDRKRALLHAERKRIIAGN